MNNTLVSIVIPAYNEEKFIGVLLEKILQVDISSTGCVLEVIVVDDGSQDRTADEVKRFPGVVYVHQMNQGKGAAVQTGIKKATGTYVLVQDADLEYDPNDYAKLLQPLMTGSQSISVYGSRILGEQEKGWSWLPGKHPQQSVLAWGANRFLTLWCYLLYGVYITDTLTGYKVYPTEWMKRHTFQTCGFETDHEITAKLIKDRIAIKEVPISYEPRSVEEGKKIRARDFFIALWTFVKYRF